MDLEGFRRDHDHLLEPLDAALPFPGPALLIKGSTSDQVHAQAWEYTHRLFPAMRLLELPGGHWIHVDARQAFLESVGAFLEAETPPPTHAALPTA
jgi:pimeloyl-ACP methyl ester carboxylesterase